MLDAKNIELKIKDDAKKLGCVDKIIGEDCDLDEIL